MKYKLQLDETIASPQDLKFLIIEIREYSRWYSHNSIKKLLRSKRITDTPDLSMAAKNTLRQWAVKNPISRRSLDQLINNLEKYAKSSPQITITLAAPPTVSVKKSLVNWCRENIASDILINFQYNSVLLGGLVVRIGSHIYDWSFRRQILESPKSFPEVLRSV